MMSDELVKKSFSWLAKQPEVMRLAVFRRAMQLRRDYLNRLRAKPEAGAKNSPEIEQQSLLTAILEMRKERLKASDALEEIAAARAAAAGSRPKKKSPKRDLVITLYPQIKQLQATGMSYEDIAEEFTKITRKSISSSHLQRIITEEDEKRSLLGAVSTDGISGEG